MKRIILLSLFFCSAILGFSQNIILKQDVNSDFEDHDYGPNKKFYNSRFTTYGTMFGPLDERGSNINTWKSLYFETGTRHKREIGRMYAFGHDWCLNMRNYSLRQDGDKSFVDTIRHKSQRLMLLNLNLLIYNRFNFKPNRGNALGKYLDIAGYIEYAFLSRYIVRDKLDTGSGYKEVKSFLRGLDYLNKFNYGATARFGLGHLSLFCSYRISDMFRKKDTYPYAEIPRLTAGISFDIPDDFGQ